MNKSQKIILIFIVISIVLIMLLLGGILIIRQENNNLNNTEFTEKNSVWENINPVNTVEDNIQQGNDNGEQEEPSINHTVSYITNSTDYFTIKALTENYLQLIGMKTEGLLNILSPQYRSQYGINASNVFSVEAIPALTDSRQYYKMNISEITTVAITKDISIYFVKANYRVVGGNAKSTIQAMFEVNKPNNIYYTYPSQYLLDNHYNTLHIGDSISYVPEEIEETMYNKFNYVTGTNIELAQEYFNNYQELVNYYPEEAYTKLNAEYEQKRFGTQEKFQEYVNENKKVLYLMQLSKYRIDTHEKYTNYVCADQYSNLYIFRQLEGIMHYEAFLDNYTIMTEEDVNKYKDSDEIDKAAYSITQFANMVNTKDYNAIYNVLDETFRANNFSTVENLKQYLQTNLYELNLLEIQDYDSNTYEYYVFNCKVTNINNTNESKMISIIVNQGEGTEFTMSFQIN